MTDDGNTYQGSAAIERWLNRPAAEFAYTIHLTDAQETDTAHYTATPHLEGNFPGGRPAGTQSHFSLHPRR
ncbi:hypothetical protein [Streptomyces sp. NPDC057257]|uniref:hypothetical protein n=1 Tax=Streptomyces sp. NPDC057257 TaxID=3346071 RepID=UPI0036444B73